MNRLLVALLHLHSSVLGLLLVLTDLVDVRLGIFGRRRLLLLDLLSSALLLACLGHSCLGLLVQGVRSVGSGCPDLLEAHVEGSRLRKVGDIHFGEHHLGRRYLGLRLGSKSLGLSPRDWPPCSHAALAFRPCKLPIRLPSAWFWPPAQPCRPRQRTSGTS